MNWTYLLCRYLNHPLWTKSNGDVWCYRHGRVVKPAKGPDA